VIHVHWKNLARFKCAVSFRNGGHGKPCPYEIVLLSVAEVILIEIAARDKRENIE
jgi:hypothetical protein